MSYAIAWSEKYEIGNKEVDNQHKCLFKLVGDLVDRCTDGSDVKTVNLALEFLVNYTVEHFTDEENIQIKINYPNYHEHKKQHDDFKVKVVKLVKLYDKNGSSAELSSELNKFVVKWLVNHIMQEDKKIGEYIKINEIEI